MTQRLVPAFVAAIVLVAAMLSITPWPVGAIQDDAIYVILAKSLATGEGYRQLNIPGAPRVAHYPPGYPLFLAGLWRLWPQFPDNVVLFKYANAMLLALAGLGAYVLARSRAQLGAYAAGLAAVAGTACVLVLYVAGVVLSEPLFMALLFPTLIVAERAAQKGDAPAAVATGALGAVLVLVRTIGIAVLPAVVLVLLIRKRWSSALALIATAATILAPWFIWSAAHGQEIPDVLAGKYGSYLGWLVTGFRDGGWDFARSVATRNLTEMRGVLDYAAMPLVSGWPRTIAFASAVLLVLAGLTRLARHVPVTLLFLGGYLGIVVFWPFDAIRFVIAVFPLFALLFVAGVQELWEYRPVHAWGHVPRAALLAGGAAATIGFAAYNVQGYRGEWWSGLQREAGVRLGRVVTWVQENTAPDDVVSVDDDPAVYLYTGRRTVPVTGAIAMQHVRPNPLAEDVAVARDILRHYQPRFYIVSSVNALRAADSLTRQRPELLRPVERLPGTTIFVTVPQ